MIQSNLVEIGISINFFATNQSHKEEKLKIFFIGVLRCPLRGETKQSLVRLRWVLSQAGACDGTMYSITVVNCPKMITSHYCPQFQSLILILKLFFDS